MMRFYFLAGAVGVLATVAVYEGARVLRHPPARAMSAARTSGAATASSAQDEAVQTARKDLADSLLRCQEQLFRREHEAASSVTTFGDESSVTGELEPRLAEPPPETFDPSPEQWKELARKGQVRLSRPCSMGDGWELYPTQLDQVGLAESDAPTIREAYEHASERAWAATRTTCAEWLGTDLSVVERIGPELCESILGGEAQKDADVFRHVAEVRAGTRTESSKLPPLERYYLARTRELKDFETDLARRVGAERAHRLTQSSAFCMIHEQWPEGGDDEGLPN